MSSMLKVKDLKVNYGGIEAVKGISLDVPKGAIVTLIGANGAGKSSTLRAISGLVKPTSGSIEFDQISKMFGGMNQEFIPDSQFPSFCHVGTDNGVICIIFK